MKHTRIPWDGTQGFSGQLSRHYRYQAFAFLKPNPELSWKSNREPEKAEWTEPIEKPKRRKQRNPHTFPTLKYLNLGRLMRCNVCEKYEPFCKKKKWPQKFNLFHTLLQAKHVSFWDANFVPTSISPTLYGLLYSAMFLNQENQWYWVPCHNHGEKKTWMYCPYWWHVMVVTPKMKSGRPII